MPTTAVRTARHLESERKYRESHREQRRAYDRMHGHRPEVKARKNENARIRRQKAAIACHGIAGLSLSMQALPRPKALTDLIIQESRSFCDEWGFHGKHDHLDWDSLLIAAKNIRDNPFYPEVVPDGEFQAYIERHGLTKPTNPWHNSRYLQRFPEGSLKKKMQNLSRRLHGEVWLAQQRVDHLEVLLAQRNASWLEGWRARQVESGKV